MREKDLRVTFNFNDEEVADMEYLRDFFQQESISTVERGDVVKYLLSKFSKAVRNGKFDDIVHLIDAGENK